MGFKNFSNYNWESCTTPLPTTTTNRAGAHLVNHTWQHLWCLLFHLHQSSTIHMLTSLPHAHHTHTVCASNPLPSKRKAKTRLLTVSVFPFSVFGFLRAVANYPRDSSSGHSFTAAGSLPPCPQLVICPTKETKTQFYGYSSHLDFTTANPLIYAGRCSQLPSLRTLVV